MPCTDGSTNSASITATSSALARGDRTATTTPVKTLSALAQTGQPEPVQADEAGLKEIIVTASRREQDQQRAPVALNVVGGDVLAAQGTSQAQDLNKSVAGLAISPNGAQTQVFLRGVGSFSVSANSDSGRK